MHHICRTFGFGRDIDGVNGQDVRPGSLIAFCDELIMSDFFLDTLDLVVVFRIDTKNDLLKRLSFLA